MVSGCMLYVNTPPKVIASASKPVAKLNYADRVVQDLFLSLNGRLYTLKQQGSKVYYCELKGGRISTTPLTLTLPQRSSGIQSRIGVDIRYTHERIFTDGKWAPWRTSVNNNILGGLLPPASHFVVEQWPHEVKIVPSMGITFVNDPGYLRRIKGAGQ
jgi:hypothetical protein